MKPVTQTLFGGPDGATEEIGNCYPACVATLLDLDLDEVPHVHQLHREPADALQESLRFLLKHGYTELCYEWAPWLNQYVPCTLAIFSGQSPRGDWQHAVVGEITASGWRLVHDPHPSRAGIVGEPTSVQMLVKVIPAAANDEQAANAPA